MNEIFELPVSYQGKDYLLPAQLHQYVYGYKIEVEVKDVHIFFERDEERNWRAITGPESGEQAIDREFLIELVQSLNDLFGESA